MKAPLLALSATLLLAGSLATGCMAPRDSKQKVTIMGTSADVDEEEQAYARKTGEKGKVRVQCRNESATGSHIRRRVCWPVKARDDRRAEDQDNLGRFVRQHQFNRTDPNP